MVFVSYNGKTRKPWFNEGIMEWIFSCCWIFSSLIRRCWVSLQLVLLSIVLVGCCITFALARTFSACLLGLERFRLRILFFRGNTSACADIFGVLGGVRIRFRSREVYFGPILKEPFWCAIIAFTLILGLHGWDFFVRHSGYPSRGSLKQCKVVVCPKFQMLSSYLTGLVHLELLNQRMVNGDLFWCLKAGALGPPPGFFKNRITILGC